MLTEAIQYLQTLARPESIMLPTGLHVYEDQQERYIPVIPCIYDEVSNIESFAQVVIEEARRRGNDTGDHMTVFFTEEGGKFGPDDKLRQDQWKYTRRLSQQWVWLCNSIGKPLTHMEFLRRIQGLKPSIQNYNALFRDFRKVSFTGSTNITSYPIIDDTGSAGGVVTWNMEAKAGAGASRYTMPASVPLSLQYARGSKMFYDIELELEAQMVEDNTGKQGIRFVLHFPLKEVVMDTAVKDEMDYFKAMTDSLPQLLTLLSF